MKTIIALVALLFIAGVIFVAYQFYTVHKAHSTFDNYYAFRGCSKLLTRDPTSATCELPSGQVIEIVEDNNKWYLAGDLPCQGPVFTPGYFLCRI